MPISGWGTRRQRAWAAGSAALLATVTAAVVIWGGSDDAYPPSRGSAATPAQTLLWLYAPRDIGRLPIRSSWCSGSDHCWLAQETAGATQLADSSGAWTLGATGTPRTGVFTGLPVADATGWVDFSSELSTHTDGMASTTGSWKLAAQTQSATNIVSVSAIILPVYRQATARVLYSHRATADSTGFEVGLATDGKFYMTVENSSGTTKTVKTANTWDDGAWRCVTWVLDGRSSNAGKIYIGTTEDQAASPDLATTGSWATTGPATVGGDAADGKRWPGGIARIKVTTGVAVPADNCGSLWGFDPQADAMVSAADIAWTQTGSARCMASSASTALCVPGGKVPHVWDSTLGMAWSVMPARTNRALYSSQICPSAWTQSGTATGTCYYGASPDGSKTSSYLTSMSANCCTNVVYRALSGYTDSASLYLRLWIKCSSGTAKIGAVGGAYGEWSINCTTVNGVWTEVFTGHPAVTEVAAFRSNVSGSITFAFFGLASPEIWGLTLTQVDGSSIIIAPAGSVVSTGTVAWAIDNAPAVYYSGDKGKMTVAGNWQSGACVDVAGVTDAGRFGGDGTHWMTWTGDATPTIDSTANLTQSGVDSLILRWNASAAISGGIYEVLTRDGVQATWDATPDAAWTPATPATINLDGYGSTSCRAAVQTLKIEDRP
ncbi:MAG: hypothetical protein MUC88_23285 [Planctomycetes bacterium]|jgi:hypothetical protein|nr:hypothetical protein [Planctomycetota bacterium]